MLELLLKLAESIEVKLDDVEIVLVPVSADKAAADDRYSNEMCPQPAELILAAMSEIFDPKRKRRRVKKRPPVARRVLPAMPRQRAPRRATAGRDGGAGRDDGGGSDDDGGGGSQRSPARCGLERRRQP
jgi:hypothetical protein